MGPQLLPRIKITELLMDVDEWKGFTRHFTHLKDGAQSKDRTLPLSAILSEHINLSSNYVWRQSRNLKDRKYRPLRQVEKP